YLYMTQEGDTSKTMEVAGNTMLEADTWYHVAFTYNGTNDDDAVTIYINGVPVEITVVNNTIDANPLISNQDQVSFNLGGQGSSASLPNSANTLTGYMDDMAVWSAAISQPQVQAHYLGTTMPFYTQTIPVNPSTYSVSIDDSGTDVQDGNDFQVRASSAVSGMITTLTSSSNGFLHQTSRIGGSGGVVSVDSNSKYSITTSGLLGGTSDELLFQHTTFAGDGVMTAFIKSIQNGALNPTPNAKGGIMVRSAVAGNSPYVAVWVRADNQVAFQWRDSTGANASTPTLVGGTQDNKFIRLERSGNDFTASYSTDGTNYTVIGTQTVQILESSPWGLFGLSGFKSNKQSKIKYTNVTYTDKSPNRDAAINLLQNGSIMASAEVFGDGSYLVPNVPAGSYDIQQLPSGGSFQSAPFYNAINFSNQDLDSPNSQPFNSLTVADFDGDSHLDLAFTSPGYSMFTVVFGDGNGSFTDPHFYGAGTGISDPVKISSSGEAGSDVWILDGTTGHVNWLKNPTGSRDALFTTATG
ncbi:unnamed protein product, partial [marine sediment metagenome]